MSSSSGGGGGARTAGGDPDKPSFSSNYQHQSRSEQTNQRFSSLIHDSEVFLTKLREFKPQSLGCLEARRKSSSTLIFPSPQQACVGAVKCPRYPHNAKPTPGYWIECHGAGPQSSKTLATASSAMAAQDETASGAKMSRDAKSSFSTFGTHQNLPATPISDRILTTRHDRDESSSSDDVKVIPATTTTAAGPSKQELYQYRRQSTSTELPLSISSSELQISGQESVKNDLSNVETSSHHQAIDMTSKHHGEAEITTRTADDTSSPTAISTTTKQQQSPATSSSGQRKKLNKRTMTRDDIDLHKTRRGTPNITITEPSFNHSTITYQPSFRNRKGPTKQDSQEGDSGVGTSSKSSETKPIKFHIQRFMSNENDQDLKYQDLPFSRRLDSIERQESSDSEEFISGGGGGGGGGSGSGFELSTKYESYRPQHRPSIIREDVDNECVASEQIVGQQQHHSLVEQKDFYCGLPTTTFTKKSYQQAHHEQVDINQFKDSSLELISFEEENYEKHYYGREHWNYFTNDELLGPVMLSLKQEVNNQRDHFHVLLRTVSYTLHGTIPASTICADRYDREAIVRELSEIAKLKPPLMLGQLPSTPDELLKLDHIFIKTELKVGVIYIKAGQAESEESILGNKEESPLFSEFLDLLGDRITLKGFDRYKGGLDTVHNLTGTESVYTMWRNIEIMFHVSTMLPHEENDPQKLQKKRHIGNDIVCVAFIESDDTLFWPGCIKSYFLHTFIAVTTSPKPLKEGEKRKYSVSCVCRNEVQYAFRPYLIEQDEFYKSDYFREWLLVKIVNGERASYSAPKFARMQDRTRSQLLEDITTSLANHLVTGQIPKPYRRGSWRPLGHTRASSPLEDSMKDYFEDYDHLARDFCLAFCGPSRSMLCDVVFRVKDSDGTYRLVHGVRAIMAIRSRTFLEMLYGFVPPGTGPSSIQNQTNLRAIEMKVLSGDLYTGQQSGKELEQTKSLLAKRGSVGTDSNKKIGEKERRQSMLPNLSKSISQKPNYLTVPSTSGGGGGGGGAGVGGTSAGGGTGGMIKNAFNRLVSGNWSGWSGNIKGYKGEPMHIKVDQNKTKVDFNSLAICKEIAKIDSDKLAQREFEIKEFDYETFQQTIEYIHNGQCKLSYETIPGLICAAEHYDLPDLLHACFHHANTHMKLSAAPRMMNALYQSSCFYITAMQLLESIHEYIDPNANEFFQRTEYLELNESIFTTLLLRKTLQISELKKFQAMNEWAKQQATIKLQQKQQQQLQQLEQQQQQTDDQEMKLIEMETTDQQLKTEEVDLEYRNLMIRLNKEVNIKLDKISSEDLVRVVLPTKVFGNDKIFEVMADESRIDY